MGYPGSSTLSQEIQQRVLTTFEQTLDLAANGSVQEAKLGCDFILQLDSLFQPARLLRERLENASGAVPTDDLRHALTAEPAAATDSALDLGDLENLDLNVELGATSGGATSSPSPAAVATPVLESSTDLLGGGDLGGSAGMPALGGSDDALSGGSIGLGSPDDGDDSRIEELLAEGQSAFEKKEYQSAIDAWSRIFLIDVDHGEASRRIELARNLKAEHERQVEESFHEAMSLLDAGSMDEAAAEFEKVLAMQPDHMAAREYLDKVRSGTAAPAPPPTPSAPQDQLSAPALSEPALSGDDGGSMLSDIPDVDNLLEDPSDIPPADVDIDSAPLSEMPTQKKKAAKSSPSKKFLAIGGGVLLLVLAVGGFLWSRWDSMFPNSEEAAPASTSAPDPIARAQTLHANGKTSNAIGILKRLSPADPNYQEAQALIEQWQVSQEAADTVEENTGPSPEDLALRDILIGQAEDSYSQRRYIRAESLLAEASDIAPLEDDILDLRRDVAEEIKPIASELAMFRQGDWEYTLPKLWRTVDADPDNLDALQMLADAYYNLGVRDLQRGDMKGAMGNFAEVVDLSNDEEAQRLHDFSETYLGRSEDLLYKTLVKYLPFREL